MSLIIIYEALSHHFISWNPIYRNLSALVPENASPNILFIFQAQKPTPEIIWKNEPSCYVAPNIDDSRHVLPKPISKEFRFQKEY